MADRPPAHATGCNCTTAHEHTTLVKRVDASYLRDDERARERHARSSTALRARVLAAGNGHTKTATA